MRYLYALMLPVIVSLILSGCQVPGEYAEQLPVLPIGAETWVHESVTDTLTIKGFEPAQGVYFTGSEAVSTLTLSNSGRQSQALWLGYSLQDGTGTWHDVPAIPISLPARGYLSTALPWEIPSPIASGAYKSVMAVWDRSPEAEGAVRLANAEMTCGLLIYNHEETFASIDPDFWSLSRHTLGRTRLRPDNVFVANDLLNIRLQAHRFDGGEIRTKETVSYGAYEVRMKLPLAPSSLTGFFHYKAPDYYHEIDIEIINDQSGTFYLVTYADGGKQHEYVGKLPFDPTAGFHNYRIEYYPTHLAFYVDDELIIEWLDGYSHEPMYLMLNCWFPSWLEGITPEEDQYLQVEWIRY